MKILILAIAHAGEKWLEEGIVFYRSRLPKPFTLEIQLLPPTPQASVALQKLHEQQQLLSRIPNHYFKIALEITGKNTGTEDLAKNFEKWSQNFKGICCLIGGANGHSSELLTQMDWCWSLSSLTFPHGLARLLVVEQIYRIATLQSGHPYHKH